MEQQHGNLNNLIAAPTALPRLSREFIDYHATGMVRALQKAGYTAYLVGGCVRDLLVGHMPKDFDIGTTALPQEVKRLLSFSFIIGRRFRLVLVKREDKQYEVATFRREPHEGEFPDGVPFGDNIFGTPEQDAFRRDFTCNAIFYDPSEEKLIDYVNGQKDVSDHIIRMIGDPRKRLPEDPIRILRALRFAHKLHFRIESELREHMSLLAESLAQSVLPRRREEYFKLLRLHDPAATFREGFDLNLWKSILPDIHSVYERDDTVDIFEDKIRRLDSRLLDPADTPLLAGTLILGWLRCQSTSSLDEPLKANHIHSDQLKKLASMQLGLHNWELGRIARALTLQRTLIDVESFKRKGQRRKIALLLSEAFPLAVDLAHIDAVLDPETLEFWDAQLETAMEDVPNAPPLPRSRQRPPRPRRGSSRNSSRGNPGVSRGRGGFRRDGHGSRGGPGNGDTPGSSNPGDSGGSRGHSQGATPADSSGRSSEHGSEHTPEHGSEHPPQDRPTAPLSKPTK